MAGDEIDIALDQADLAQLRGQVDLGHLVVVDTGDLGESGEQLERGVEYRRAELLAFEILRLGDAALL
jgi:hypothetical protein